MSAEQLLGRLAKVKQTGHQKFMACCPAHDDRSPSLAIKECEDGRVLLHCFAGCEIEHVLSAVELTISDLMPERIGNEHSLKPQKWLNAKDALSTLDHEALVVSIIGADFLERKNIDEETWELLAKSVNRINETRTKFARCKP